MNKKSQKIKAVVFDYTGVIEIYEGPDILNVIAEIINIPVDVFREEYFKHNHLSNIGNIKWEELIVKVISVFNSEKKMMEKVLNVIENRKSKKNINEGVCDLFVRLRKMGFKIAIFSNYASGLREKLQIQGILKLVDEVVVSSEIGFQKPSKEAFEILFQNLEVFPGEVIFIDDTLKSLEKADEIGYTPILFENNLQLKKDLNKLGIKW